MKGRVTYVDPNVLPLGSYDVLIGMDWLKAHRVKLDCYHKTFECMDEERNPRVVRGIPKVISVRQISAMRVASCMQLILWRQQRMKLLGWRYFSYYKIQGCFS